MHPDAADELERLVDLIDEGKLPETACPRLFYQGHKLLYGIYVEDRTYKCVACGKEGTLKNIPEHCECGSDDVFDITNDKEGKWECVKCKHQWIAWDGTICPACGEVKK